MQSFAQKQQPPSRERAPSRAASPGTAGPTNPVLQLAMATSAARRSSAAAGGGQVPVRARAPVAIQAKLAVGAPGDAFEQEADRAAEQVLRIPEPRVQRACACGGACPECRAGGAGGEDERLRAKPLREGGPAAVPSSLAFAVPSSPGRPLDPAARAFMEPRFGRDFGGVRVHLGREASDSAARLGARAYALGSHIVFGEGEYAPSTSEGRKLLAHELTHVLQQQGGDAVVRRQVCTARRLPDEIAQSASTGFVSPDVVFTPALSQLDVYDFAVNGDALPAGATGHPDWQRAMSLMAGDPSIWVAVTGYTDCVGSQAENLGLRRRRVASVLAVMPPAVQARVRFSFTVSTDHFVDPTNATPEARARNRSVRITFRQMPPTGVDPCDMLARAHTIDEYLFLVRCMESRLGLTSPADAPRALSVLRQMYYGASPWTERRGFNTVWESVIPTRPWSAGDDPRPRLGRMFGALQGSATVESRDIGHLLAGIDAMMAPGPVELQMGRLVVPTTLQREEWATWAGDVGAAAADWVVSVVYGGPQTPASLDDAFRGNAEDADLAGDVDGFVMRAGLARGAAPSSLPGSPIRLSGTLSEMLLQYFRITGSALGRAGTRSREVFVETYGGRMVGGRVQDPAALVARLRPAVEEFASMYMLQQLLARGYLDGTRPSPPGPQPGAVFDGAVTRMTERFVRWLEGRFP